MPAINSIARHPRHIQTRLALGLSCALVTCVSLANDSVPSKPVFTAAEIKAIVSHGPWPAPTRPDASNRVSGKHEAAEFGTVLFFDQRLSGNGKLSCANCHVPERNWTDNQRRGVGIAELDRNTPTLMNLTGARWDGAADSLWAQSLRPILDKRELGASTPQVARLVRGDADLACRYPKAFGAPPPSNEKDDEALLVNVGKALAAFQETLTSGRTPFDHFRDALARGAALSSLPYSEAAQRGLKIFIGKGSCTSCHSGANFTSGDFYSTGLSRHEPTASLTPGGWQASKN